MKARVIHCINGIVVKKDNARITIAQADMGDKSLDGQYVNLYFTRLADAGLESDESDTDETRYNWNREKTRGTRTHKLILNVKRIEPLMAALCLFEDKFLNQ